MTFARLLGLAAVFLIASASLASAFQSQIYNPRTQAWETYDPSQAQRYYQMYGRTPDQFQRQIVKFRTAEKPGTIVIDADKHFLYYVLPDFQAIRYGIGVGREGFGWAGVVDVGYKTEWPTWTPPKEMIERDPRARRIRRRHARRAGQSAGRAGDLSLRERPGHDLPHPRHVGALVDRAERVVGLHPHGERGRHRPLRARRAGRQGHRPDAGRGAL
jgi:lipoprotein-anchoring transpeptidase ErfK/SrfK